MRKYSNGLITQQKIIDTCRTLFYENGFKETTFAMICRTAGVNPGTVAHHFTNKINIATIIYQNMVKQYHDFVREMFPDEDLLQQVMTGLGLHIKVLFEDAAYRKFSAQYLSEKAFSEDKVMNNPDLALSYRAISVMRERMDDEKLRFYLAAFAGMGGNIETYIDKNIDEMHFENSVRYYFEFHYLFIEDKELHEKIDRALYLMDKLEITSCKFDIDVQFKE